MHRCTIDGGSSGHSIPVHRVIAVIIAEDSLIPFVRLASLTEYLTPAKCTLRVAFEFYIHATRSEQLFPPSFTQQPSGQP